MNIAIYQIDPDRDENNVVFLNYENLERFQDPAALRSEIYDKVFEGEVECGTLEEVYQMFNLDHPDGYRGRSLSVSDVVEVVGEEKSTFHFCDSIGFREVDFDPDMTEPLKEKKIKVVLCEPGKVARVAEIGTELSDLQRVVGGLIEPYYPFEEQVCIVCNDEGKYNGMRPCRAIYGEGREMMDIIFGPFFICDTQLFQQLYYQADSVHGGRLPVHVHFVMDEFANVALPDEFDKLLSTMRSREISVSIIIQNLAQLKALFEKQWESIVGNCDEFLYLGGNEQSTHEYVSKLLGKETIDTNTYGRSRGRNGSYSTNYQLAGRELMTPDEVRMLDNRYALLFIRGERPIRDLKYDILHHPNVALTTDGSAPAYTHGEDTRSIASMAFSFDKKAVKNAEKLEAEKHEFLLYSEEELEELLDEKEKKDNEET